MAPNVCYRKCMWIMRYFNIVHYWKLIYNRLVIHMLYIYSETMEKMMRRTHVNLATKQCCYLCCQLCYVAYNGDYSWDKYLRLIIKEWNYWIHWWCRVSAFCVLVRAASEIANRRLFCVARRYLQSRPDDWPAIHFTRAIKWNVKRDCYSFSYICTKKPSNSVNIDHTMNYVEVKRDHSASNTCAFYIVESWNCHFCSVCQNAFVLNSPRNKAL